LPPCASCGGGNGAGPDRGRGWVEGDDYTGRRVGSARTGELVSRRFLARCDAAAFNNGKRCERWGGEGKRETSPPIELVALAQGGRSDPRLAAMERRERVGSYAELRAALQDLRARRPLAHRLVVAVYVENLCEPEAPAAPAGARDRARFRRSADARSDPRPGLGEGCRAATLRPAEDP
jgi:hypothetical protein